MNHQTIAELNEARKYHHQEHLALAALAVVGENAAPCAGGIVAQALRPGAMAPDFILPDTAGKPTHLQCLLKRGPVALVFYRGGWCPYCNIYLRGLQRSLPEFERLGAQIVAISPQLPQYSLATRMGNSLDFPALSDVGNKLARRFGIAVPIADPLRQLYDLFGYALPKVNGGGGERELPAPGAFVIDSKGVIQSAHVDESYPYSVDPEDLIADFEHLDRGRHRHRWMGRASALDHDSPAYSQGRRRSRSIAPSAFPAPADKQRN